METSEKISNSAQEAHDKIASATRLLGLAMGPYAACGQTGTGSRIRAALLAGNRGAAPAAVNLPRPTLAGTASCL